MISKLKYLAYGLLGIFGLVIIYQAAYSQKIYPQAMVGQKNISNLTIDEATKLLNSLLPTETEILSITFGEQVWPISLGSLEITYLTGETAEKAWLVGRSQGLMTNLKQQWQRWWEPEKIGLALTLNETALEAIIEEIGKNIDEEAIETTLNLKPDGTIELVPGRTGREVDKTQLRQQIWQHLEELNFQPIEAPIQLIKVEISTENLTLTKERAERLKNKKMVLKWDGIDKTVAKQELIDLINFDGGFNEEKIATLTANLAASIDRPAQNPTLQFDGKRVIEFKPALSGWELNQEETGNLVKTKIDWLDKEFDEEAVIEPVVITTEPGVTTGSINDLGIKEIIGKGESLFRGSIAARKHNVALTAAKLNGTLVAPGETFSFNNTVGDISAATGFQQAYVIQSGRTVLGDGGGVCQDSTTLFRAVLNAGLPITARQAHAYRVGYYEQNSKPGFDATVYSPSTDFRFVNDTPGHILIQTKTDLKNNKLTVELYGSSDGRKVEISNVRLWGQTPAPPDVYQDDPTLPNGTVKQVDWAAAGAKAAFDWKVTRGDEVLQQKTWYSNYRPWQAVYLRGTGG